MRKRAVLRHLDPIQLATVRGGLGILLPALAKPKQSAGPLLIEEISINFEKL